jgi:hypothetical protein
MTEGELLVFVRQHGHERILVALNLGSDAAAVDLGSERAAATFCSQRSATEMANRWLAGSTSVVTRAW